MDKLSRKAINFDLDTNELRKTFKRYTEGYRLLRKAFKKLGFKHEQGSGYISAKEINNGDIRNAIGVIVKENPWLAKCVKKFKITEPTVLYEGEFIVADISAALSQKRSPSKKSDKSIAIKRLTETLTKKYAAQGMAPDEAEKFAAKRASDFHNGNIPVSKPWLASKKEKTVVKTPYNSK